MKVRVGVDAEVDDSLLANFGNEIEIVRVAPTLTEDVEIDFWLPMLSPQAVRRQWEHLKGVRVVQIPWAGIDSLVSIFDSGVILCDARGVHDIPTAEWALSAILAMQKNLPFFFQFQQKGQWIGGLQKQELDASYQTKIKQPPLPMVELSDTCVLIVGYGSVGRAIEARLRPFGATCLRIARSVRDCVEPVTKLEELLPRADIVVLTIPLTSETRKMIDAKKLACMKTGALLVNASRGAVVDTGALLAALEANRIRAAVDVTDPEPLPEGHPLWHAPNLLITPHVAGDSEKFIGRLFRFAGEQAERFARGESLLNVVSGQY